MADRAVGADGRGLRPIPAPLRQDRLLKPAAVDHTNGYRWYGTAELARLERIRGLQRLGLSLRQIIELVDASGADVRQALTERVSALRRDIAALSAEVIAAEDHLAVETAILPQETTVGARRLRIRRLHVENPAELTTLCATTLLTWLTARPTGGFAAAVATVRGGETLVLPPRSVVRAHVPASCGVVDAGVELFAWLRRTRLTVAGPTVEEHLCDADGRTTVVLEVPVSRGGAWSVGRRPGSARGERLLGGP